MITPSFTVVCAKMTNVRGIPTMLTFARVFFFMTQCGLLGPMQKYVNMPHRLDKCFLFILYLVCFFLILPIRKNFALC